MSKLSKLFKNPYLFFRHSKIYHKIKKTPLSLDKIGICRNYNKNNEDILLIGFKEWKWNFMSEYLPNKNLFFLKDKYNYLLTYSWIIKNNIDIYIWGYNEDEKAKKILNDYHKITRVEDGFIRSFKQGVMKSKPLSLVMDSKGLYFNAKQESNLEYMLNTHKFTDYQTEIARKAISRLKQAGLSKYNDYKNINLDDIIGKKKKHRVLVIGQVEDDASIKHGYFKESFFNNDIVKIAKSENPDSEIIYKIHPDLIINKRDYKSDPKEVKNIAHIVDVSVRPKALFLSVDKVYTVTSLMGFEALWYNLPVVCIGSPFYSGWGITEDRQKIVRRERKLCLEEIFYISFLKYPRYLNSNFEVIINEIHKNVLNVVKKNY